MRYNTGMTEEESHSKIGALITERQALRRTIPALNDTWAKCIDLLQRSYADPDRITVRDGHLHGSDGQIPDQSEIIDIWTRRNDALAKIADLTRDLKPLGVDD